VSLNWCIDGREKLMLSSIKKKLYSYDKASARIKSLCIVFCLLTTAFLVLFSGLNPVCAATSDYDYYKTITIESDYIDSTLTNFPILIHRTSDSDLASHCQSDGDDIAFFSNDNTTQYSHEIEYFNGTTGELVAWVNVTSISSSSDTSFWMYYGDSDGLNQQDIDGTWDSDYLLVCHMNSTYDSSSNHKSPDSTSASPVFSSGYIGDAFICDGNDYLYYDDDSTSPASTYWCSGMDTGAYTHYTISA